MPDDIQPIPPISAPNEPQPPVPVASGPQPSSPSTPPVTQPPVQTPSLPQPSSLDMPTTPQPAATPPPAAPPLGPVTPPTTALPPTSPQPVVTITQPAAIPTPGVSDAPVPQPEALTPYEPGNQSLNALRYSKTAPAVTPVQPGAATPGEASQYSVPEAPIIQPGFSQESGWLVGLKAAGVFVATFLIVFVILQFPAFLSRIGFFVTHLGQAGTAIEDQPGNSLPILRDRPITLTELKDRPERFLRDGATLGGVSLADVGDNQLLIPKINVSAPIVWESEPDETTMLASLQQGIAHYGFTALPSDGRGNVFLTGHSSFFLWDPGKFKTVFANLDRLEPGDQFAVTYQGVAYLYQVSTTKVVKPSETSVLDQTENPTASLMTCVPVGTSLNRLVVQADLLSKQPNQPIPLAPPGLEDPASIFHYLPV